MVVASRWWVILKPQSPGSLEQARGDMRRDKHRGAATASRPVMTVASYHAEQGFQPVGLGGRLVPADAMDARETHRNAGFVPARGLDGIESDLEDECRTDRADGPELLNGVVAHEAVELQHLLVGEAGIGLAHRHELVLAVVAAAPGAERIVGV